MIREAYFFMETNLLRLKYLRMRTLCFYFAAFYLICQSSQAELRIDVTQGRADPMPIAVTVFKSDEIKNKNIGKKISTVISANLERSGLFAPINPNAFLERLLGLSVQISLNAQDSLI